MPEQSSFPTGDLAALWEQMGASTGSFLGKIIGLSAQYGLSAYEQVINSPLQQAAAISGSPSSETSASAFASDGPANIREQTWQEMGKQYGEAIGTSVGLMMDLIINSLKVSAAAVMPGYQQAQPQNPDYTK